MFKVLKSSDKETKKIARELNASYARNLSNEILKVEMANAKVVTFQSLL